MNNTDQYSENYTIEVILEINCKKIWIPFRGYVVWDWWNIQPFTYDSIDDAMKDIENYNLKDWRIYKLTYTKELKESSDGGHIRA